MLVYQRVYVIMLIPNDQRYVYLFDPNEQSVNWPGQTATATGRRRCRRVWPASVVTQMRPLRSSLPGNATRHQIGEVGVGSFNIINIYDKVCIYNIIYILFYNIYNKMYIYNFILLYIVLYYIDYIIYLIYLIYLVYLVYLIYLIYLIYLLYLLYYIVLYYIIYYIYYIILYHIYMTLYYIVLYYILLYYIILYIYVSNIRHQNSQVLELLVGPNIVIMLP